MNSDISPRYVQIAAELRQTIDRGVYQIGDQLPTEAQLAERFEVNRHTVRQAIALLKTEGLLRVDQGRGTFVAAQTIRYPIGKRVRYNEALKAQGWQGRYQILRTLEILADPVLSRELSVELGEPVALVESVGFADQEAINVSSRYFPLRYFPDFLERCQGVQSISWLLQQAYDCDHLRRHTRVSARMVKSQDARLLGLPLNQPILLVESINVDQQGRVIEYGVSRFRGDRMELVIENEV